MLENFLKQWSKPLPKNDIIDFVLNLEEHSWIKSDKYMFMHMQDFLERLPTDALHKVFIEKSTVFKLNDLEEVDFGGSSVNSFSIHVKQDVFEQLNKINDGWAKAALAHEVGLVLQDAHLSDDEMETKVDADEFVCKIGYLDELEESLHQQVDSVEKMVRLSFITSFYFSQEENQIF